MQRLNNFILSIPYLFLMKVPYLWLPAVVLYRWPPLVSMVLCSFILLGLLAMRWQENAWIDKVKREFTLDPEKVKLESVRPPAGYVLQHSLLLLMLSVAIGWVLNGYLNLSGWQWGWFTAGFLALYRKSYFFGRTTTYIFTDQGLGIRFVSGHLDYRMMIRFHEIRNIQRESSLKKIPLAWTVISSTSPISEGLLLVPKNIKGFTPTVDRILLWSNDLESLLEKFPPTLNRTT